MKLRPFAALAMVFISVSNGASAASAGQPDQVERQIRKLNDDFFRSINMLNLSLFNQIVAEDALFTRNNKFILDKEQTAAPFSQKHLFSQKQTSSIIKNVRIAGVKVRGTTAIVAGRFWSRDDNKKDWYVGFTNVFTQTKDKDWKLVASALQVEE